ncbi:TonB-dependent receptor [Sphaerospermopsis torques-reginae]|uniref:TonB-dependent receptor n=1 Tax=Sphaerospermopsis torques-reginae ITEP-024 TaxID=984208 RepID=A0ABX8WVM9_9CYAN|nr:TonB-dependent receptor [Sphaerospermopsis torques-reginae]QYX30181.1 TonB-dependent receptor [Sphaerospermopsis torques-reginae ITEP-024]
MRSHFQISDLSNLQYINDSSNVIGGSVTANTDTVTSAGYGYAIASATGFAKGNITYTETDTDIKVYQDNKVSSTIAKAEATAFAQTGNHIARSKSSDTSIWFSVH